jgi:hypothetical protein
MDQVGVEPTTSAMPKHSNIEGDIILLFMLKS